MELFACGFNGFGQIFHKGHCKWEFILPVPLSVPIVARDTSSKLGTGKSETTNTHHKDGDVYMSNSHDESSFDYADFEGNENLQSGIAERINDVQLSWDKMLITFNDETGVVSGITRHHIDNIHSAALAWKEILYTDSSGQCHYFSGNDRRTIRSLDNKSPQKHFISVVAGNMHTVLKTDQGEVFSVEKSPDSTLLYRSLDISIHIKSVCCGKEHVLLLSAIGVTFTYGIGGQGQLGHGSVENEKQPRVVEALEGITITAVSAGGWHSAALSDFGDVYIWGWNERGQLGFPSRIVQDQRDKLLTKTGMKRTVEGAAENIDDQLNIKKSKVEDEDLASKHDREETCQLDNPQNTQQRENTQAFADLERVFEDTRLALAGKQPANQIPISVDSELVNILPYPRVLDFISASGEFVNMLQVACGSRHTAALTEDGEVYTWGWNDHGQLGHGDTMSRDSPSLLKLPVDRQIKKIFCGAWNTAMLG